MAVSRAMSSQVRKVYDSYTMSRLCKSSNQAVIDSAKDFISFVNKGVSPYHGEPHAISISNDNNCVCSGTRVQAEIISSRI